MHTRWQQVAWTQTRWQTEIVQLPFFTYFAIQSRKKSMRMTSGMLLSIYHFIIMQYICQPSNQTSILLISIILIDNRKFSSASIT